MENFSFYFSLIAFLIHIIGGIYFFVWWIISGRKHLPLLYFAYGLGVFLLFKIPNILANFGVTIVQKDFYPFFFISLLLYFSAYIVLIKGVILLSGFSYRKLLSHFFKAWFGVAVFYFALSFFGGYELTYAPVWMGHILFYIPAQFFLLNELWWASRRGADPQSISGFGVICAAMGTIGAFAASILYIVVQTMSSSRVFWYFSAVSSWSISIVQIISGLFLFVGLYSMARSHLRSLS